MEEEKKRKGQFGSFPIMLNIGIKKKTSKKKKGVNITTSTM